MPRGNLGGEPKEDYNPTYARSLFTHNASTISLRCLESSTVYHSIVNHPLPCEALGNLAICRISDCHQHLQMSSLCTMTDCQPTRGEVLYEKLRWPRTCGQNAPGSSPPPTCEWPGWHARSWPAGIARSTDSRALQYKGTPRSPPQAPCTGDGVAASVVFDIARRNNKLPSIDCTWCVSKFHIPSTCDWADFFCPTDARCA